MSDKFTQLEKHLKESLEGLSARKSSIEECSTGVSYKFSAVGGSVDDLLTETAKYVTDKTWIITTMERVNGIYERMTLLDLHASEQSGDIKKKEISDSIASSFDAGQKLQSAIEMLKNGDTESFTNEISIFAIKFGILVERFHRPPTPMAVERKSATTIQPIFNRQVASLRSGMTQQSTGPTSYPRQLMPPFRQMKSDPQSSHGSI